MKAHARSNSVVYLLERTLRFTRIALQREFKSEAKISVDQWLVLQQANNAPGSNQHEIAEACAKDPANVTRILRILEKRKLVSRKTGKNDKRIHVVAVTESGKKTLTKCRTAAERFRKTTGKGISQDELNLLRKVLDKLYENSGGRL